MSRISETRQEPGAAQGHAGHEHEGVERFVPETMGGDLIAAEHLARYHFAAGCVNGLDVLDAGCGVGYGSQILSAAGARSVIGVDISPEAVDASRARQTPRAEFRLGDLHELPVASATVDVVVCFEAIEHVDDPEKALDELRRVLRPGGLLVVSSPNRGVYMPGNPFHVHEYTTDELELSLRNRFSNVSLHLQHAWATSMISDERTAEHADASVELPVSVRKTGGFQRGEEVYTVALASDSALPTVPATTVLGDFLEIAKWHRLLEQAARDAEAHHRLAEQAWATEQALRGQLWELGQRLLAAETANATLLSEQQRIRELEASLHDAHAMGAHLTELLAEARRQYDEVKQSTSWKVTAPLRALTRRRR